MGQDSRTRSMKMIWHGLFNVLPILGLKMNYFFYFFYY